MLYDGELFGTWRIERDADRRATLCVDHVGRPATKARAALRAEGRRLLSFLAPDQPQEIRFTALT